MIKFNFVINHVLKSKLPGFVIQAWEIALDVWVHKCESHA